MMDIVPEIVRHHRYMNFIITKYAIELIKMSHTHVHVHICNTRHK